MHIACESGSSATCGSENRMGAAAFATGTRLPSGLVNASRVTPLLLSAPPAVLPLLGSNLRLKNCVTSGVVVGRSPAGMGANDDAEPGALSGCVVRRLLPGGSTCTSV